MKNFGFRQLYLVNPLVAIGDEARKFASHAQEILNKAVAVKDLETALRDIDIAVATTSQTARSPRNVLRTSTSLPQFLKDFGKIRQRYALVFGRETTGLTNDELSLCEVVLIIPVSPAYPTLNISHAAAILFYELTQCKRNAASYGASRESLSRLRRLFSNLLRATNLPEHRLRLTERAFGNVVSRGLLTRREATLLLGAFRKILASTGRASDEPLNRPRRPYAR